MVQPILSLIALGREHFPTYTPTIRRHESHLAGSGYTTYAYARRGGGGGLHKSSFFMAQHGAPLKLDEGSVRDRVDLIFFSSQSYILAKFGFESSFDGSHEEVPVVGTSLGKHL